MRAPLANAAQGPLVGGQSQVLMSTKVPVGDCQKRCPLGGRQQEAYSAPLLVTNNWILLSGSVISGLCVGLAARRPGALAAEPCACVCWPTTWGEGQWGGGGVCPLASVWEGGSPGFCWGVDPWPLICVCVGGSPGLLGLFLSLCQETFSQEDPMYHLPT